MPDKSTILGIDVGSVSVACVEISAAGALLASDYAFHHGSIEATLSAALERIDLTRVGWIATISGTPESIVSSAAFDAQVANIAAARHFHSAVGSVLAVGGEKFALIRFDEHGNYRDTRTNSSCAAGTGSFLDQQAKTLGFGDSATLADEALRATGTIPKIASRCAVFAKTDLIHAQQEGFSREAICEGLCQGLAAIVADTLFAGDPPSQPVIFVGGVARNNAVVRQIEKRIGCELIVDEHAQLYGALGAAFSLAEQVRRGDASLPRLTLRSVADVVSAGSRVEPAFYEPLELRLSDYPDFSSEHRYDYQPTVVQGAVPIEVDIYRIPANGSALDVTLGIDVGSTSTKVVLLDGDRQVVAGFYTRTSGRPLQAVQGIFEAIDSWQREAGVMLCVRGAGTTGSGRKFIGAILGADLIVDEITAHARAAVELDPQVDTIIEIGGQDAKFTTLRDGVVTSAIMNTVCAAGTGSFIEEQAQRLDTPLSSYSDMVEGACAPMASDRCTVFMQRDINHLLSASHSVREILATTLHSVRENYLMKVAREGNIGEHICFQGATAKNKALVAAFEQRLGKPIKVSRYCHLTGALGVAHMLAEQGASTGAFRGFDLFRETIPIRNEICELCNNNCKIVSADVMGETAAYGFLCGRDFDIEKFVSNNSSGFDLLKTRRRIRRPELRPVPDDAVTVGIPEALYLVDDLEMWRQFFNSLGARVVTSAKCPDPVGTGKELARAEFCAPMSAYHGHLEYLASRADIIFAPVYLEAKRGERNARRQYCYYSQYAGALADTISVPGLAGKLVRPLITQGLGDFQTKARLYTALKPLLGDGVSYARVATAFADAIESRDNAKQALKRVIARELDGHDDVSVVLLGRPYTCLLPNMNKGIPDILASIGVKTFFQDMLMYDQAEVAEINGLLDTVHWHFAAQILEAAVVVAARPGLYPVIVTSFKCAPDSFTLEYVRRIMDARGKPYLVLELDEHDSSVGYETRIEAAVRSFRNHYRATKTVAPRRSLPIVPKVTTELGGRTLLIPSWDRFSCELIAANLRREGIDAHTFPETEQTIRKSLRHNTGQCIPLNAIAQGFIDDVKRRGLDPGNTALWFFRSEMACNIGMYPSFMKSLFESEGGGFENAAMYVGDITCFDISTRAAISTWLAYMFGGLVRRLVCTIRPYEKINGAADGAAEESMSILRTCFESGSDKLEAVRRVVDLFADIETGARGRPKVAIFGDMYTRDNEVMSQDLVRFIERHGGEVITTPYSEYAKIVAEAYFNKWFREGRYADIVINKALLAASKLLEKKYAVEFSRVLGPAMAPRPTHSMGEMLALFGISEHHTGESLDNILKVLHIVQSEPDVSLFVQANPAFCCPALVTEAMSQRIEEVTGVPVVTITYDGTAASRNDAIIPYLQYPRKRRDHSLGIASTS